jgi:hypothetical protein
MALIRRRKLILNSQRHLHLKIVYFTVLHFVLDTYKTKKILHNNLFPTLIPLSGVGTTWILIMLWYRFGNYFYDRPPACQPSLKLEWVLTTVNATGSNGLTCLPNKFWSPILFSSLRTLLSFYNRMPNALNAGPSSSSNFTP